MGCEVRPHGSTWAAPVGLGSNRWISIKQGAVLKTPVQYLRATRYARSGQSIRSLEGIPFTTSSSAPRTKSGGLPQSYVLALSITSPYTQQESHLGMFFFLVVFCFVLLCCELSLIRHCLKRAFTGKPPNLQTDFDRFRC